MLYRKPFRVVMMLLALMAVMVASTGSVLGQDIEEEAIDIVLVAHAASAWDSFWGVVEQGNYDAAADFNVNLTILAPDEWCPACVVELIDQATALQPDAIGVTVTDGALFEDALQRALASGVPVLSYNSADQRPEDERLPIPYIGQDEYIGGFQGAQRMIEAGATAGVCVNHNVGNTNLDRRCRGFVDAMAQAGFEAEVLGIPNEFAEAQAIISDYAAANPDVDSFMTLGPNGATPFYAFLEAEGFLPGDLVHGTFDLGPQIVENIRNGTTLFGIDQQPYIQGYMVVQWLAWNVRQGITLPGDVLTGPGFVDAANVDTVEALAGTYR